MMKFQKHIGLFLLVLSIAACEKTEFPENEVLAPSFQINGTIDGQNIDITPGVNGYYLFTDTEEINEGNYALSAFIENTSCEDCEPSLGIVWTSNTGEFQDNEFDVNEDLIPAVYDFGESNDDVEYFVDLSAINNNMGIQDLVVNDDIIFDDIVEIDPSGDEFLTVSFTTFGFPFCYNYISLSSSPTIACEFPSQTIETFSYEVDDNGLATFYPPPSATDDDREFEWSLEIYDNGGGMPTMANMVTHGVQLMTYQFDLFDVDYVEVYLDYFLDDENDLSVFDNKSIVFFGDETMSCDSYTIELFSVAEADEPEVMLVYNDGAGNEYYSDPFCMDDVEQDEDSFFEILSVEEFENNENGDPTKKIEFNTSCQLFMEGETIEVIDLHGTIAFAYPE